MNEGRLRELFNQRKRARLLLSLAVDAVGLATYLMPVLGEGFDLGWAPIAAAANFVLHGGALGAAGGIFTFAEEMLPFTDVIPSVTLTWFIKYVLREEASFREFAKKQ
jgi:hypothetical protein